MARNCTLPSARIVCSCHCSCVALFLCPHGKWLTLALHHQLTFFAIAALPSLLGRCPRPGFAVCSRPLPSRLRCRCLCIALVLSRHSKWLALEFCHQLAFFALAALPLWLCPRGFALAALPLRLCHCCSCFAVTANVLCSRFATSLRSLPSRLHPWCGFAVIACASPSWRIARTCASLSARVLCPCGFAVAACALHSCFAVEANGVHSRFAVSSGGTAVTRCTTQWLCFDLPAPALPSCCAWPLP